MSFTFFKKTNKLSFHPLLLIIPSSLTQSDLPGNYIPFSLKSKCPFLASEIPPSQKIVGVGSRDVDGAQHRPTLRCTQAVEGLPEGVFRHPAQGFLLKREREEQAVEKHLPKRLFPASSLLL